MSDLLTLRSFSSYFTDAVLRGPTIGCMLMCLAGALVGVMTFLRKQSLLGESLSHAAYPGVVVGAICAAALSLDDSQEGFIALLFIIGSFTSALLGLWMMNFLERKLNIRRDSCLCFVLSAFFGVGLTLVSELQVSHSSLYRQIQVNLYGQAATMTDVHIAIYGGLAILVAGVVVLFYKELQIITFNRDFAKSLGIRVGFIDGLLFFFIVLAIVIGIRSVGVVLISAMLIAPAAAARQYTNKLSVMFALAAFFGVVSGFFGNYFSVEMTEYLMTRYPSERIALPTGPVIVIVASSICFFSLLFAPKRGVVLRMMRIARFRYKCVCENVLKTIWRFDPIDKISFEQLSQYQTVSAIYLHVVCFCLARRKWWGRPSLMTISRLNWRGPPSYCLTKNGSERAARVVRLHRLWEVYLVEYLGVGVERVHSNAEEMEHVLTPELEHYLTTLLKDPKQDPHHQPIPPRSRTEIIAELES